MRQQLYIIIFISATWSGCKSVSYLNTPNDLFKQDGVIYMLDGTEKKGKITVMLETGHDADRFIRLRNGDGEEKVLIDSIKSYKTNEDYLFPKN